MSGKYKVNCLVGIRPDFIRTSKLLRLLNNNDRIDLQITHTGQHYDENLSGTFFKDLNIPEPKYWLDTRGRNHNEQHAKLIDQYSKVLEGDRPDVTMFLGDANAVMGCIAPLKLGIPIAHIEAGSRSYDWKMPEERNRVVIDSVSDVLYTYQEDYRIQLVQEGIAPHKIVVVGNIIVDVLEEWKNTFKLQWPDWKGCASLPQLHDLEEMKYAIMTLHRDEHMNDINTTRFIIENVSWAAEQLGVPVILIEMPRLKAMGLKYPSNFRTIPPLDFFKFHTLERSALIEFTDSGTNQEVASIVGVPCVVTRTSTERPDCGDCGTTVLATGRDIVDAAHYVTKCAKRNPEFTLGDGRTSERIVKDLLGRLDRNFDNEWPPVRDIFKLNHFKRYTGRGFVYG